MKIIEAHVYGFGKWQNESIPFVDKNFTAFYGKNEAGKSTLRQFILYILFGLPPKELKKYIPYAGGPVGGRLVIEDETVGTIYVERERNKRNGEVECSLPDGTVHNKEWWKRYLKGIDRSTYEAIFSFDLQDLQHIQKMDSENIGDVLFGVGMTGSKQIYDVESTLEKEMDRIFKKQGKKPLLNEQLSVVKDTEQEAEALKREEETYVTYQQQVHQVEEELANLLEKRESYKHEQAILEKYTQASETIFQYQQRYKERMELPTSIPFPEQGMERYYQLKEQDLPIQSEQEVLAQSIKTEQEKLNHIQSVDPEMLKEADRIIEQKQSYDLAIEKRNVLEQEIQEESQQISRNIDDLGLQLTFEEVERTVLPFYMEEEWERLANDEASLSEEETALLQQRRVNQEERRHLEEEINDIKQSMMSQSDEEELRSKMEEDQERVWQQAAREEHVRRRKQMAQKQSGLMKQIGLFGTLVSIVGLSIGWGLSNGWLLGASVLSFVGTWALLYQMKQTWIKEEPEFEYKREEASQAEEWQRALQEQQDAKHDLRTLDDKLQQCRMQDIKQQEQLSMLRQRQARLDQQVADQLAAYPFLQSISLSYWPKAFQKITLIQQRQQEWLSKRQKLHSIQEEINEVESQLFLCANRLQFSTEGEIKLIWSMVFDFIKQAQEEQRDRKRIEARVEETQDQYERLSQKRQPIQEEMNRLFETADVTNAEDYLKQGELYKKLDNLENELFQLKDYVERIFMDKEKAGNALAESLDESILHNKLTIVTNDLEDTEKDIENQRQTLADLRSLLRNLEQDERYSAKRHEVTQERDQVRELAKQWATYKIAHSLVQKTKQMYQEERMPSVIEYCSHFFSILTKGAYLQVFLPEAESSMTVERADGYRFSVEALSQGTKEQLYTSLRLALSQSISETHPLPFIIDDAFVNFDGERTDEVLQLLEQISQDQQVIIFTCNDTMNQKITERKKIFL